MCAATSGNLGSERLLGRGDGGRSGEWLPEGGQSGRQRGRMLCPRARPLAPPGPRAGTHAEGMGRTAGERKRGIRPPLSSVAAGLVTSFSLTFVSSQGRLAARSRSDPALRAALLDNVTSRQPRPLWVQAWPLGTAQVTQRSGLEAPARKGDLERMEGGGGGLGWRSHPESKPCLLPL